ncbi:uncharacterized protein [Venturia canescens]|uniref:uncharacterized protein isoform X2 n=1 Tax=Venturia canescens TaxID=32260 RepID=UPI001C9D1219|nr:uncharacterized protein LOC122408273 isoform X2 [Venturia canescens]
MNPATVKQWLTRGELEKLENVVLEGRGARLLGEHSPDLRTRVFLKALPNFLTKISQIHDAVTRGSLPEVQKLVADEPKKKLALAKDSSGTPLIHKAVYNDHQDIVEWFIHTYPTSLQQKDREGRTALHYCSACKDPDAIWELLIEGGCDSSVCDKRGNPAAYYLSHNNEIELPEGETMARRKGSNSKEYLDFKPSNIRIWIHNRDISKLQQVLWEGHGSKLRVETSNNPRVRKFLEATPFIMDSIKTIHSAVIKNDLEGFKKKIASPVSPIILCSKDVNGLNVLHKAAGLGYTEIAREIIDKYPAALSLQDNDGRTPLHYAAIAKDEGATYDLLVEHGADENKLDNKQRSPPHYKHRSNEIDLTNLVVVPEAPRVSGSYPKNWDWRILESDEALNRAPKKVRSMVDIDRAFGSPEVAPKNGDVGAEDLGIKKADDALELEVPRPPEVETLVVETEEFTAPEEPAPEEGPPENDGNTSDDELVVVPEAEEQAPPDSPEDKKPAELQGHDDEPDSLNDEENNAEEPADTNVEEEERNEPSTGDSGLEESTKDEDQVIVGEHAESPEAELNEGSMAVDLEVEDLLENGNMEQLAALVLNGEGRRLVGRQSSNPELQAFIDNVPAYIGKIHAVHMAAREGNLRDLQSSLDRRKFAIARDGSSPHGATPLHVAVIFGHTAIIRYLAGRFPETTHALDIDGRTPLHYAATLADNGHYYNLLLHLAANPLVQDNFGQKADYYKDNQSDLSHKRLLRDFGAREKLADEMLTDKVPGGDLYSSRRDINEPETLATLERCFRLLANARRGSVTSTPTTSNDNGATDVPIFRTEEGRYLASSLGDPLIKGLTEVAHTRPNDPVTYLATYLYNFASKNKSTDSKEESNVLIIPNRKQVELNDPAIDVFDDDAGYPKSPESEGPESTFNNSNRDEHGQSMLHFTAVRTHPTDGLFNMLQETQINVGFRDELYRTARDVAEDSNIRENVEDIDRWVVYLAARGETEKLVELLLEGYDHILDAEDAGINIVDVAAERNREATVQFLQSINHFSAQREKLHSAIRAGDFETVKEIFQQNGSGSTLLAVGKNIVSRCALHIAVLGEHANIVEFIAKNYPDALRTGDNLERTALHYAMGVPSVEILSGMLIKSGAKRVHKDLKSRQPSYYFMNKTDIQKLQEEEESIAKANQM